MIASIFSTAGSIIFGSIAITAIAVALVILRNHSIDFGAKGYKFKLGPKIPELSPPTIQSTQVSAKPDSPSSEDENVANQKRALAESKDDFLIWIERLRSAKKSKNRNEIEGCFDAKYKNAFVPHTDYEWELWKHTELMRAGFVNSVREIERLERENPTLTEASRALARYFINIGAAEKASIHVETAITRATNDSDRVSGLLLKAEIIEQTKGKMEAKALLYSAVGAVDDPEQKAILFLTLGDIYEKEEKPFDAIASFEQATRHDPHNKSARFRSAFLCASIDGLKLIALRQYQILRNQDEEYGSTVNNLGILYGELGHDISKIKQFKAAADQKEEWGYGNLIIAYLEAGFIDEAERLIISAPDSIKRGERFIYAQSLFNDRKKAEDESIRTLIENAEIVYQNANEPLTALNISAEVFGVWTGNTAGHEFHIEKSGEFIKVEQIDPIYRRWGIVSDLRYLAACSIQQERREKSPPHQTYSLLSLAMDGPSPAGDFILCRAAEKLRVLQIKEHKLIQRMEYTKQVLSS